MFIPPFPNGEPRKIGEPLISADDSATAGEGAWLQSKKASNKSIERYTFNVVTGNMFKMVKNSNGGAQPGG